MCPDRAISTVMRGYGNYGPQNALDSTLAWGDILTLTATEIVSVQCAKPQRALPDISEVCFSDGVD